MCILCCEVLQTHFVFHERHKKLGRHVITLSIEVKSTGFHIICTDNIHSLGYFLFQRFENIFCWIKKEKTTTFPQNKSSFCLKNPTILHHQKKTIERNRSTHNFIYVASQYLYFLTLWMFNRAWTKWLIYPTSARVAKIIKKRNWPY